MRAVDAGAVKVTILGDIIECVELETVAVRLEGCKASRIVAIAGGAAKHAAIAPVLESGRLSGLIADEATARALLTEAKE